jgi:hypothetical protein
MSTHRQAARFPLLIKARPEVKCLLRVIRAGLTEHLRLPFYPGEQTFSVWAGMSQEDIGALCDARL